MNEIGGRVTVEPAHVLQRVEHLLQRVEDLNRAVEMLIWVSWGVIVVVLLKLVANLVMWIRNEMHQAEQRSFTRDVRAVLVSVLALTRQSKEQTEAVSEKAETMTTAAKEITSAAQGIAALSPPPSAEGVYPVVVIPQVPPAS